MKDKNIEEEIKQIINDYVRGKVCSCGGGGYDYDKQEECKICNGSGIYDWNFDLAIPKIKTLLQKAKQQGRDEMLNDMYSWLSPNKLDSNSGKVVRRFLDAYKDANKTTY